MASCHCMPNSTVGLPEGDHRNKVSIHLSCQSGHCREFVLYNSSQRWIQRQLFSEGVMVMVAQPIKPSDAANCSPDSDKFVLTRQYLTNKKKLYARQHSEHTQPTRMYVPDLGFNLPQQNTLAYIAGYLCRGILREHELLSMYHTCRAVLLTDDADVQDPVQLFTHFKVSDTDFESEVCRLLNAMCECVLHRIR